MRPGDLVKQAPNIFADRKVGGRLMLVIKVKENAVTGSETVTVMLDGNLRVWHAGELEVVSRV
jgi:hypothetical protein